MKSDMKSDMKSGMKSGMKSMMKRIGIVLLLAAVLMIIASCGKKSAAEPQTDKQTYVEPQTDKQTYVEPQTDKQTDKQTYTVVKTDREPDWSKVPVLQIDQVLWTDDFGIRAQGQLCYSEEALFVHLSAVEKDIRAENTAPLSPVYEDSCLEFFFKLPDAPNYFNFEINPNGCLCGQFGPDKTDRINIVRSDAETYFDIHTDRTPSGWEVFYKIPLEYIRLFYPDYQFEGQLAANFYKCGNKTVNKHYLSWAPIALESPNFHCPEYFGVIRFAK